MVGFLGFRRVVGSKDVIEQALAWTQAGRAVAFVTVVGTWGSSPRPAGSQMAVDEEGAFVGSVSGGCVEGAAVTDALDVMKDGKPRLVDIGVSNERAWEVGLACGGRLRLYVERAPPPAALASLRDKRPLAWVTDLQTGGRALVGMDAAAGDLALDAGAVAMARSLLRADRADVIEDGGRSLFVNVFNRPLKLVVVGAVHIAQALAPMASAAGYEVTVIDPRRAFSTAERFPGVRLLHDWPDEALTALGLDARTALVTLTHDPKLDDPALEAALRSEAFYIGALGSGKTQAKRLERLRALGFDESALKRIYGPVGLDLGGRLPAEIAVAILGQIVAARNKGRDAA
jgi:xanthine dehydrogenase accessory factor